MELSPISAIGNFRAVCNIKVQGKHIKISYLADKMAQYINEYVPKSGYEFSKGY